MPEPFEPADKPAGVTTPAQAETPETAHADTATAEATAATRSADVSDPQAATRTNVATAARTPGEALAEIGGKYMPVIVDYLDKPVVGMDSHDVVRQALSHYLALAEMRISGSENVRDIAAFFQQALQNPGTEVQGFAPITTDVKKYLDVKDRLKEAPDKKVVHLSIGGTHAKAGRAIVHCNHADVNDFDTYHVHDSTNEAETTTELSETELWDKLISPKVVDWITDSDSNVAITFGIPLVMKEGAADGHIMHFSGKFNCPTLAPFDLDAYKAEVASGPSVSRPSIAESLSSYLAAKGISLPAERIAVAPNDTVAAAFGVGNTFINGTGTNACIITADGKVINTELGHGSFERPSLFDLAANPTADFESMVSGKFLGKAFRIALENLVGREHRLYQHFNDVDDKEMVAVVFGLVKTQGMPPKAITKLSMRDLAILTPIARSFVFRAADRVAKIGAAIELATGNSSPYAIEGSVFTKNPWFVRMVNSCYSSVYDGRSIGGLLESREIPVTTSLGAEVSKEFDASFAGGFIYGACVDESKAASADADEFSPEARAQAFAKIAEICRTPVTAYLEDSSNGLVSLSSALSAINESLEHAKFWRNGHNQRKEAADSYRQALDNPGVTVNGFTPSVTSMSDVFSARERLSTASPVRVIGVSMGGTNNKIGTGTVENGQIRLEKFQSDSLRAVDEAVAENRDYSEQEFWEILFPRESAVRYLRELQSPDDPTRDKSGNPLFIAVTFGTPVNMIPGQADGFISHHSTKIRCDALAPFDTKQRDEEIARGTVPERPSVATSLVNYLKTLGIDFPKENVAITPNDTASSVVAYGMSSWVSGTGVNAGIKTPDGKVVNTESCDANAFKTSFIEQEAGLDNMFEPLVCGEHIGQAFKVAVEKMLGPDAKDPSSLYEPLTSRLQAVDFKDMAAVVFNLAAPFGKGDFRVLSPLNLTSREYEILRHIAKSFISRAANLMAQMGIAFENAHGFPMTFATEGSVLARNPWFVEMINNEYKTVYDGAAEALLVNKPLPVSEVPAGRDGLIDASSVGGFIYAACVNTATREAA